MALCELTYDYQLNGVEGTYEVRAYPVGSSSGGENWSGDWSQTPVASVMFTDAFRITAKSHEGQRSNGSYGGNVFTYTEGDQINFRFTLTGDPSTSGQLRFATPRRRHLLLLRPGLQPGYA